LSYRCAGDDGVMTADTEERKARNDAIFREANEQIRAAVDAHGPPMEQLPFICECADESCTDIIRVPLEKYRAVREHPRQFLVAPGHEEDDGAVAVVEREPGYVVVEKTGRAGEVAEQLAENGP
jgi:hypothetical protein